MESSYSGSMADSSMLSDDIDDEFCELSDCGELSEMQNSDILLTHADLKISLNIMETCNKVEALSHSEVRWFYSSSKHGKLKPFIGNDSLRIEEAWCELQQTSNVDKQVTRRVCVRGGMFEVDVDRKECIPVYWSPSSTSKETQVVRGTWFFKDINWSPLDEDVAARIEREHLARWRGLDLHEIKEPSSNKVMHTMQLDGYHVEWDSVTDVRLYKDATAIRAYRNIAQKLGVSKATSSGYKLHRSYKAHAVIEDVALPVTNLVFVIHGIGAKSDRQKIVRNTSIFRAISRQLELKHFKGSRTEFLPIEWRSRLLLDDGVVDLITPRKGQGMRRFLNNTALDVMYYTSPLFRSEIVDGLCSELNRVHALFREKNPTFAGKISVFAHSLGSVIFHDILTKSSPVDCSHHNKSSNDLNFTIDSLFCVGSPLAMFSCLHGKFCQKLPKDVDEFIPLSLCRRFYNIFHPADPVAYRVEPLLYQHYTNLVPVQLPRYAAIVKLNKPASPKSGASPPIDPDENPPSDHPDPLSTGNTDGTAKTSESSYRYLRSVSSAVAGGASRIGGLWNSARRSTTPVPDVAQTTSTDAGIEIFELNPRIDYELQEGFTESKLGYASFTSHTSYWSNQDLSMFLLTQLYKDIKEPHFV